MSIHSTLKNDTREVVGNSAVSRGRKRQSSLNVVVSAFTLLVILPWWAGYGAAPCTKSIYPRRNRC